MHAGLLLLFAVVVVVECYCFLIYILVGPPQPWPPHFYFVKVMFSTFSAVSLQSGQGPQGVSFVVVGFLETPGPI